MADGDSLPGKDRIKSLPRWAIVAFAARCASRALAPRIGADHKLPRRHREAAIEAVRYAELAAAQGAADVDDVEQYSPYRICVPLPPSQLAVVESSASSVVQVESHAVVRSASHAARSAHFAVVARGTGEWGSRVAYRYNAAMFAQDNERKADESSSEHAVQAMNAASQAGVSITEILADLELLFDIAKREKWNKHSLVPVAVFEQAVS